MKTSLLSASRLLLLGGVFSLGLAPTALAQSSSLPQPISVDKLADFTYLIRVSNPQFQHGHLKVVRLSDNAVLYDKYTSKPSFGSKLNVEQLPDGEYAFIVKVGKDETRYTLDINTRTERTTRLGSVSMTAMAK